MIEAVRERFSKVRAIYFDLDDTLCGYWDATKAGLRESFEQVPVAGKTTDEMVRAWGEAFRKFSPGLKAKEELYEAYLTSGKRTRTHQMQLTLQEVGIDDDQLAEQLSEAYMVNRDKNLKPFHDAHDVLEILYPHYPIGLITNGPADIQNQEIDTVGIRKYLSNIFIEGEMRVGKPERTVFERAEKAVNLEPEQILMVGNSFHHDIIPAIEYGWATVWTRRDTDVPPSSKTGKPEEIPTEGPMPDLIVDNLRAILPYLGR